MHTRIQSQSFLVAALAASVGIAPIAQAKGGKAKTLSKEQAMQDVKQGKDLYATFETSQGTLVCKLFTKEAPKTVENFVGLATGAKPWTDPNTRQPSNRPLYDGTIFHRVIPNFMIQGGDPLGNGTGDPGYKFEDEFQSAKAFDKPGMLAMANSGPNTNGSQFFITQVPTPWLTGKHTIFGEVVSGLDLVTKIINVPRGPGDRPTTAVVLKHVTISEQPPKA
jgi:peptidyl-prolyl cis-trans isomerase A (cyclophilin A)